MFSSEIELSESTEHSKVASIMEKDTRFTI
jgi:hypothetical protein